ncbi:predicted protein [Nematostella vectensis]|uniref:U4/U6.U5 small nuclear ribonucleoprotein 27 kDa protein n=1 Tax=Nematostella vectensis TaxID=45351 RepID=A7RH61_NEMVE|nr:predicted protein [Nematostella vectensis]|eukprot:XP_001641361.1 predicted protein [Nematostella vectensis]
MLLQNAAEVALDQETEIGDEIAGAPGLALPGSIGGHPHLGDTEDHNHLAEEDQGLTLQGVGAQDRDHQGIQGEAGQVDMDLDDTEQEEDAMMKMMGFSNFDSTKGKHVEGSCNLSGISVKKARKYRQYMNRKGGFNRPLDYVA